MAKITSPLIGNEEKSKKDKYQVVNWSSYNKSLDVHDISFFTVGSNQPNIVNTFSNMRNGLVGHNFGYISSRYAVYENMVVIDDHVDNGPDGNGIFLENGKTLIHHNTFNNLNTGINISATDLDDAFNNTMTNVGTGVRGSNQNGLNFNVIDNTIDYLHTGIRLAGSDNPWEVSIVDNDLNVSTNTTWAENAIVIEGQLAGTEENKRINQNTMDLRGISNGIWIQGAGNYEIAYNQNIDFTESADDDVVGIRLFQTSGNFLYANQVNGFAATDDNTAYQLRLSPNNTLCCNGSTDTGIGIDFGGSCNATQLRHSEIGSHDIGLLLQQSTITGQQYHTGNTWLQGAVYGTVGARNDNFEMGFEQLFLESGLSIEPPFSATLWPPSWDMPNAPNADWFKTNPDISLNCTDDTADCIAPFFVLPPIKAEDIKTAKAEYVGIHSGMLNWESAKYLYNKIERNTGLIGNNTDIDDFYAAKQNTSIGIFHAVEQQVKDLYVLQEAEQMELDELRTDFNNLSEDIWHIDSLYQYAETEVDTLLLEGQKAALITQTATVFIDWKNLIDNQKQQRLNAVVNLLALNQSAGYTSIFEQNERTVNEIMLQTMVSDIFTLDEWQFKTVKRIAEQCPLEGGSVVFRARNLYQLRENRDFEVEDLCNNPIALNATDNDGTALLEVGKVAGKTNIVSSKNEITFYPNPANQKLFIEFDERATGKKATLIISNVNGHRVVNEEFYLEGSRQEINISKLTNGVYFCYMLIDGNIEKIERLIIIH